MDDRHAWEQPGAHEEAPGVWRIPLPLPGDSLKAVNVYAVADGDRLVMIDGAGHYPHVQFPQQTLAAVLPFLAAARA